MKKLFFNTIKVFFGITFIFGTYTELVDGNYGIALISGLISLFILNKIFGFKKSIKSAKRKYLNNISEEILDREYNIIVEKLNKELPSLNLK